MCANHMYVCVVVGVGGGGENEGNFFKSIQDDITMRGIRAG